MQNTVWYLLYQTLKSNLQRNTGTVPMNYLRNSKKTKFPPRVADLGLVDQICTRLQIQNEKIGI